MKPHLQLKTAGLTPANVDRAFDGTYRDMRRLRDDLTALVRGTVGTTSKVSGTIGDVPYRFNVQSISAGTNVIVFGEAMPNSGYNIHSEARNAAGNALTVDVTGKSRTGFTVLSPEAGEYAYWVIGKPTEFANAPIKGQRPLIR
jgi:hypothetical protein